jgi:hypothetical protein
MCQWNPRTSVKALLPVFLLKPNFLSLANGLNVRHREGVAAREQNSFGGVHPVEQLVLRNVTRQDGPNCSRQDLLHLSFPSLLSFSRRALEFLFFIQRHVENRPQQVICSPFP